MVIDCSIVLLLSDVK